MQVYFIPCLKLTVLKETNCAISNMRGEPDQLDVIQACCEAIMEDGNATCQSENQAAGESGEREMSDGDQQNISSPITTTDNTPTRHPFDKTIMKKMELLRKNCNRETEQLIVIAMCHYIHGLFRTLHKIIPKYLERSDRIQYEKLLSEAPDPLRIANYDIGKPHRKITTEFLSDIRDDFGWVLSQPKAISIHYFQSVGEVNTFAVLPMNEIFLPRIKWQNDETPQESVPLKAIQILNKQLLNMLEIHLTNRTFIDLFTLFGGKDEFVREQTKWGWVNDTYAIDYFRSVHDFIQELVVCGDMSRLSHIYRHFCLQQIELSLYKVFLEFQRLEIAVGNTTRDINIIDAVYKHHIRIFHLKSMNRPVDEWFTGNPPVCLSHTPQSMSQNQFECLKVHYTNKCIEARSEIHNSRYRKVYDFLYPIKDNNNET